MVRTGVADDRAQLVATFERLFGFLRRLDPQQDISLTVASTLHTLETRGPHRLSDLAAAEGVTQPAMTQLVSRLERDGLATRCTDPRDRRVVVVRIADPGRALLRRRREARSQQLGELVVELTPQERASIMAALPALDKLADLRPG